jgi:hypothetical protein
LIIIIHLKIVKKGIRGIELVKEVIPGKCFDEIDDSRCGLWW